MIKIGVLTILKVNNYGAELQATALAEKLNNLGYSCEIIDYLFYKNRKFIASSLSTPLQGISFKGKIKNYLKYKVANFILEKILPLIYKVQKDRLNNFKNFHTRFTPLSKEFRSINQLYRYKHNYDIFIVGSDCVWCPYTESSIEPYFLTFAPEHTKKISYASSFGVSSIPENLKEKYRQLFNSLSDISTREKQGVQIIKNLISRNATLVLDPTLLLTGKEWDKFLNKNVYMPEKFIVIYQLYDSNVLINLAHKLSQEKNIPILRICKQSILQKRIPGIKNIKDAGPSEFLSYIKNATFVLTDSFHGTVFSINFKTNFFTILSKSKKDNSRLENILSLLNLEKQLIWEDEVPVRINEEIDFTLAEIELDKWRKNSLNFLITAIEK